MPQAGQGDCIDCKLCVQVCPVGIDIRNGAQIECTNCTACIDECNIIMQKTNKPQGLIRYDSFHGIVHHKPWSVTWRVAAYTLVLLGLLGLLAYFLYTRKEIEAVVKRVPGTLAQHTTSGMVSNLYNIQMINKSANALHITIHPVSMPHARVHMVGGGTTLTAKAEQVSEAVFFLEIPEKYLQNSKEKIKFQLLNDNQLLEEVHTNFINF